VIIRFIVCGLASQQPNLDIEQPTTLTTYLVQRQSVIYTTRR